MPQFSSILFIAILICSYIDGIGQCTPLRFNTSSDSGWKTCTESISPNEIRGISSWLHYDLGETHQLGESWLWNYNDFNDLASGVTQFAIDYLSPSGHWAELGVFDTDLADGTSTYGGQQGPNFEGIITSEVLITFLDNGGSLCFGIGEWKISAVEAEISSLDDISGDQQLGLYPNPTSNELNILITDTQCNDCQVSIVDHLGRQVILVTMSGTLLTVNVSELESGIYSACLNSESDVICGKFSVLTR